VRAAAWSWPYIKTCTVAEPEARPLYRAPRHVELPCAADRIALWNAGSHHYDSRRNGPRGTSRGAGAVSTRPRGARVARDRRGRRGHQPPARATDGELRSAVEPESSRATLRTHPSHRSN